VLDETKGILRRPLAEAKTKGIPVIAYGQFINRDRELVDRGSGSIPDRQQVNRLRRPVPAPAPPPTKDCQFCFGDSRQGDALSELHLAESDADFRYERVNPDYIST
jgi:hypothetical protein